MLSQCVGLNTYLISSPAATIIAALLAVGGGIWGLYRQKEYELVKKRYLEEGLDVGLLQLPKDLFALTVY